MPQESRRQLHRFVNNFFCVFLLKRGTLDVKIVVYFSFSLQTIEVLFCNVLNRVAFIEVKISTGKRKRVFWPNPRIVEQL